MPAPILRRTLGEHIEVRFLPAQDLLPTLVDPTQLENALLNLCLNARDAMAAGGQLTLETANTTLDRAYANQHPDVVPGDYTLLAVSDSGVGIDTKDLHRVFEPFFTTKGKGTGLGLAMVYGFASQPASQPVGQSATSASIRSWGTAPRSRCSPAWNCGPWATRCWSQPAG